MIKKPITGTNEWAKYTYNIQKGCKNGCRYCYAKQMAIRFGRCTPETWLEEEINQEQVDKRFGRRKGRIMFPSTHDVHMGNLEAVTKVLHSMLKAGNEVLLVSKPDPRAIETLCVAFREYTHLLTFRFTIGSANPLVLKYWEPHAPDLKSRVKAMEIAHASGFPTGASCEPLLDGDFPSVIKLVEMIDVFTSDTIWLGLANNFLARLNANGEDHLAFRRAQDLIIQQDEAFCHELYVEFSADQGQGPANPRIRWKESMKKVLGLDLATKAGEDK
jgi:DNA repair photolyase